ncbi:DUF1772 domain-containing protein [Taibaiella chishuiensis]|uniref:Uncharacterized protein DUF1772 n=1 Tax=Taibaiella chishuiensis TaxID=1434707 RepID=A0A2P8CXT9_9BACT|nr:DUF1772 domain-containing protein [Taibaiella chishuiensis]PSK89795.1 uncharacterized protein DUF1772 [Taibaiella chishuiensis]
MQKSILWYCSLVLVMLVTGVFWGTWFTLTRSLDTFPADHFIRIGQTIIHNVAGPMRVLMPLTLVMQLLLCIAYRKQGRVFYALLAAFGLMIVTLLITLLVEVPIDNQIRTWTSDRIPADWRELRATWKQFHAYRTLTSILSFALLSVPALLIHRKR